MKIDCHQHFWLYDSVKDAWITDDMKVIQRDFLPNDISKTLKDNRIDGVVAVQADQSVRETEFLVELATAYKMIKGVVGWVDLRADDIESQLLKFSDFPIIKGFRHIVEGEPQGDFLSQPEFLRGIKALTKYNYTYDLLIRPRHYASTLKCVTDNPEQQFMLDHMAKPAIATGEFAEWAAFITALSAFPNVYCKISGLVTEADWKAWSIGDFEVFIKHAIDSFGRQRICFGSDWPVSTLAATYAQILEVSEAYLEGFTDIEKAEFFGGNAVRFYNLK
ncbi:MULTISPECIES: amidohydrolase family protein [Sphingobacterium]|uniref:amidohydrolase family protein n=1 Tax=Sphingobacterium TaxID=28453 RepID=UPI0013DC7D4B|nr:MULTISPECIES: amidohydrolase family protein [unclassified Sphingobacterium]